LVIADLAGESEDPRSVCEHYYSLISQYREIHWVFMVSRSWYSQAVELLMCPTATLLSDVEPIENLVKTVRSGNTHAERISAMLTSPAMTETHDFSYRSVILTLSERKVLRLLGKVLRLLGKGWGINQIASLLKKSNKTISAQKNSAMRRLAIHSNAEMYAWINSAQGARELNLPSVYGDAAEWNTAELRREMSHS
ncbi:TPA: response regulator transcription factor, partial [Shigella flexneri]|nr:response regulator transcription factor [Shigella flexneri]